MSGNMTHGCPLLEQLLAHYNATTYPRSADHVLFSFILDTGEVLRGDIIGVEEFNEKNSLNGGGHLVDSFSYAPSSEADTVYLSDAEILSNGHWVRLGNLELARGILKCCAERGFRP
jgi:hypothetical protein